MKRLLILAGIFVLATLGGCQSGIDLFAGEYAGKTDLQVEWCAPVVGSVESAGAESSTPVILDRGTLRGGGQVVGGSCKTLNLINGKDYDNVRASFTTPDGVRFEYEAVGVGATNPLSKAMEANVQNTGKALDALTNLSTLVIPTVQQPAPVTPPAAPPSTIPEVP